MDVRFFRLGLSVVVAFGFPNRKKPLTWEIDSHLFSGLICVCGKASNGQSVSSFCKVIRFSGVFLFGKSTEETE